MIHMQLGQYEPSVNTAFHDILSNNIFPRIWEHDHTVWRPEPTEITNRLDWLHMPDTLLPHADMFDEWIEEIRKDGYTHVLLMGMGGSSLAPEVFQNVYGQAAGPENNFLELAILDSTDPDMILARASELDLSKTLFIIATKSGGTVETLSAFKYFYNQMQEAVGEEEAGLHFIAITDPESYLETLAEEYDFRAICTNYENIGGRYAALSYFGLFPAALVGVDLARLLERAQANTLNGGLAHNLGCAMGALAKEGRDKLTIVSSSELENFSDWVEQLIAESTGKDGKGILPIVGEALGTPDVYGDDRLFVYLRLNGDTLYNAPLAALADAGHPVITFDLDDIYELGTHFFMWKMATVIASHIIDIQPFDQPNVESAKNAARQMVAEYMEKGVLPEGETTAISSEALDTFLAQAEAGDYIAIHAYVHPTSETDRALNDLRLALRDRFKLATTVGYGPRFLHSTGQLHKGDGGNGLFIQFISEPLQDVPIPDKAGLVESAMSFGVLKNAQALGDAQALADGGRRVIRFNLGQDVVGGLKKYF